VNDPKFFLSESGKSDPQAELEETLRSFFKLNIESRENTRCRFVARYTWLKEQLKIDESKLSPTVCTELEQSMSDINPKSVTLIFPVAYLNSPASMFGHTLLRIDGSSESALISLAVNYSAVTSENKGIMYAYKGVTGGFQGYYSANPYYEKVREYSGIEHRDIWEYRLDLTPEETKRLFYHVWEMQGIGSNYYFLDRNCSYAILYLLEIARPSLKNINDFLEAKKVWVLPSDTVRVVIDSGIVAQESYRPSLATRIKDISNLLSDENRQIAYSMSTGAAPPAAVGAIFVSKEEQVRMLDLSVEYINYMATRKMIEHDEYIGRVQKLLKEKSKYELSSQEQHQTTSLVRPDQGHLPSRLGIGAGCRTGSCFAEVNVRPLFHDRYDSADGYIEGSTINIMHTILRYNTSQHHLDLHSLHLIDIESLSPRDLFFRPLSWKFNVGAEQKILPSGKEDLVTFLNVGLGVSRYIGSALIYTLAEAEVNVNRAFNNRTVLGAGGIIGVQFRPAYSWDIDCSLKMITPLLGSPYSMYKGELVQNIMIDRNNSLMTRASRENMSGSYKTEISLLWNIYY